MLMVRTKIAQSGIHGLGLFAAEPIPAGTLVWQYVPGFDVYITKQDFEAYPEPAQQFVRRFGSLTDGIHFLICTDNARFMNHSFEPNITADVLNVALRDIAAGEEIVCDYREFDIDFAAREIGG